MVSEAMSRLLEIMKQNFSLFATIAIVLVALALYVRCGGSLSGPIDPRARDLMVGIITSESIEGVHYV